MYGVYVGVHTNKQMLYKHIYLHVYGTKCISYLATVHSFTNSIIYLIYNVYV